MITYILILLISLLNVHSYEQCPLNQTDHINNIMIFMKDYLNKYDSKIIDEIYNKNEFVEIPNFKTTEELIKMNSDMINKMEIMFQDQQKQIDALNKLKQFETILFIEAYNTRVLLHDISRTIITEIHYLIYTVICIIEIHYLIYTVMCIMICGVICIMISILCLLQSRNMYENTPATNEIIIHACVSCKENNSYHLAV